MPESTCCCSVCGCNYAATYPYCPSCPAPAYIESRENGPVHSVQRGRSVRVSDRNGNPKDLDLEENSVLHSDGSSSEMVDGSTEKPLTLNLQKLPNADGVVVIADGLVIGQLVPSSTNDQVFGLFGGTLGFQENLFRDNLFEQIEASSSGKIAILLCSPGGHTSLGTLQGQEGYIKISTDGNLEIVTDLDFSALCELSEITDSALFTHSIVCGPDGLKKYKKVEEEPVDEWIWISPSHTVWDVTFGTIANQSINVNLTTIPGYTPECKRVYIQCKLAVSSHSTFFRSVLDTAGEPLCEVAVSSSFGSDTDSTTRLLPIATDKILPLVITNAYQSGGGGSIFLTIKVRILGFQT